MPPILHTFAASSLTSAVISPAEMVMEMVMGLLDPKTGVHQKLDTLRELCMERITFDSPEQVVKVIKTLSDVISIDPNPEVRAASLEVMERMMVLEEKAEAEQGKPSMDWAAVYKLMDKAQKRTEFDTLPVASRFGPPSPETARPQAAQAPQAVPLSARSPKPAATLEPADDGDDSVDPVLLMARAKAVSKVQKGKIPAVPPAAELLASSGPENAKPKSAATAVADFAMPDAGPPERAIDAVSSVANPASSPAAGVPPGTAASPKHLEIAPENMAPQPGGHKTPAPEEKTEPPIMKFLRSIADTDEEEHIRALASRVISKIENLTAQKTPVPAASTPTATEG